MMQPSNITCKVMLLRHIMAARSATAGAIIGGYLFGLLGISSGGGLVYSIIVAIIGACVLIGISRLIAGRRPV